MMGLRETPIPYGKRALAKRMKLDQAWSVIREVIEQRIVHLRREIAVVEAEITKIEQENRFQFTLERIASGEISQDEMKALAIAALRERDRSPKGRDSDLAGSIEDESPVAEGNSPTGVNND